MNREQSTSISRNHASENAMEEDAITTADTACSKLMILRHIDQRAIGIGKVKAAVRTLGEEL